MVQKIYSWKTNKVNNGYSYSVQEITPRKTKNKQGQYADTKTIKSGVLSSRAKAKLQAQKIVRFFNQKK